MNTDPSNSRNQNWPTLAQFPVPVKALISFIILTMMVAMLGALGQIVIHDILPTFFAESSSMDPADMTMESKADSESAAVQTSDSERGDLFSEEMPISEENAPSMPFFNRFKRALRKTES